MDDDIFDESFDNTFIQLNNLGNLNEHYVSSHKFNLFQQFYVIGLEPKIIYNINKAELKNLPKILLEPKIISKYPNIDLPYLCIPDYIIISHCFPNGTVDIITKDEKGEKIKDGNFIFSLDNQGYEEKENSLVTKKVYYTCYSFYENIEDYRLFVNLRNSSSENNGAFNKNYYIKKVICISSFKPIYKKAKYILRYLRKYIESNSLKLDNGNIKIMKTNLIPIEKIIEGLIFNIPSIPRAKYSLIMNNDTFDFDNNNIKDKKKKEIIFRESPINKLPKPIFDYSDLLIFFNFEEIFEIIKWIILEMPILFFCENLKDLTYTIEGITSLIFPFEYPYPIVSILPEENYSMITILKHYIFGINHKFNKEACSQKGININKLDNIIIVKIEKRDNENQNLIEREKSNSQSILIFASDKKKSILELKQLNSHYNDINVEQKDEFKNLKVQLPSIYKEKLKKKFYENIESKITNRKKKTNMDESNRIITEELNEAIFNYLVSIMLNYQQFCYKSLKKEIKNEKAQEFNLKKNNEEDYMINKNKIDINEIFDVNNFLNIIPQNDKLFYSLFVKTQLFLNYIKKKQFPKSLKDKLEILFFDEKINEKQAEIANKKISSPFLNYEFNELKGNLFLSSFRKKITPYYNEFLLFPNNQKRALNYFQYITESQNNAKDNDNEENQKEVSFNYLIFPKLLNDDIFYKEEFTIEKFWDPEKSMFTSSNSNCIYNQFEKKGKLLLNDGEILKNYEEYDFSKESLPSFNYSKSDYISILWLQYFAKTFHYNKLSERKIEFEKMMIALKSMKKVDQNTINILFWIINKHGDNEMNKKFFDNLQNKNYINYLALREKSKKQNNFLKFPIYARAKEEEEKNENDTTNKNKFIFYEYSNCENKLCNQLYSVQNEFLINESSNNEVNIIKFNCEKCQKEQNIQIKASYFNEEGKCFNINFKLISPLALLKRKWFQDKFDIDLFFVIKEHLEPYMSALFYFHLQNLFHEFMIPPNQNICQYFIDASSSLSYEKEEKEKLKIVFQNQNKKFFEIKKIKKSDFVQNNKEEKKSLKKNVSQNYLKTLNKRRLNKDKQSNNQYSNLTKEELDISDNSIELFEFKDNSNKKMIKDKSITSSKLTKNNNISGFNSTTQNSYEFFKKMKMKKKK